MPSATEAKPATAPQASAFEPFRTRAFLVLWVATVVGNAGGWVRDTASAWLMTELSPSPLMVAGIQAAATLPIFLLSLPAGALADIVDRRRLMIAIQIGLAVVTAGLAVTTMLGAMTPAILVGFTLLSGVGAALSGPVWQSIVPELVPRSALKPAVALNSLGINIARAIGPAVAGAIILAAGVAAAYWLDLATYAVTLAGLIWWRRAPTAAARPEHLGGAVQAGVRYALASPPLRRVLVRAMLFFGPASCYWALLPLVSRNQIGGGAGIYGILLAAVGAGAVAGALVMPRARRWLSDERLSLVGVVVTALTTAALAFADTIVAGAAALACAGAAWIMVLTSLNGAAQAVLPNWVRGRGLAIYLMAFFGTMTAGSLAWGQIAALGSLQFALSLAAVAGLVSAVLALRLPLPPGDTDLTPAAIWPQPKAVAAIDADGGPILVTIGYRIAPEDMVAFLAAARALGVIRRRDGAYRWGLMRDAADPDSIVEWFLVASWEEHLRQHDRAIAADVAVQQAVRRLHRGPEAPVVRHLVPVGHSTPPAADGHLAREDRASLSPDERPPAPGPAG